jgi:hypothetical protein
MELVSIPQFEIVVRAPTVRIVVRAPTIRNLYISFIYLHGQSSPGQLLTDVLSFT